MGKVMFTISYEVKAEMREDYLALSREMKSHLAGPAGKNYAIYETKGKKNHFSEVFIFDSMEEYDQLEDQDEQLSEMVQRLEAFLTNGKMNYTTLLETL
jgi:antibiotic biosynthesis monooxygenase (ABM) superfamily enzyme